MPLGLLTVLVATVVALAGAVLWAAHRPAAVPPAAASPAPAPAPAPAGPVEAPAIRVLRGWDRARAQAYAAGDLAALRRLYLPGSRAGAADLAVLRRYVARGIRVTGMRMQLLAVDVRVHTPRLLQLRVTDRLTHAEAVGVGGGWHAALPRDAATVHELTLTRGPVSRWRVSSVKDR
ncbi:MAG: hypothetical protein ACXVXG_15175 [Nocardioidaceae bacterium]